MQASGRQETVRWTKPESGFRCVKIDKPHVCWRRIRAGVKLRAILYGLDERSRAPCWGDKQGSYFCREMQWAWLFRDFCRSLMLYRELFDEARRFVVEFGALERLGPGLPREAYLENDLGLLRRFHRYMWARCKELDLYRRQRAMRDDKAELLRRVARTLARDCALSGVCVFCGDTLPCVPCQVPRYEIDGAGWIKPIADPRITRSA